MKQRGKNILALVLVSFLCINSFLLVSAADLAWPTLLDGEDDTGDKSFITKTTERLSGLFTSGDSSISLTGFFGNIIGFHDSEVLWEKFLYYTAVAILAWLLLHVLYRVSKLEEKGWMAIATLIIVPIVLTGYNLVKGNIFSIIAFGLISIAGIWGLIHLMKLMKKSGKEIIEEAYENNLWLRFIAGDMWKVPAFGLLFGILMTVPIIGKIVGTATLISFLDVWGKNTGDVSIFPLQVILLTVVIGLVPQILYSLMKFRAVAKAKFSYLGARRRGANLKAYSEGLD